MLTLEGLDKFHAECIVGESVNPITGKAFGLNTQTASARIEAQANPVVSSNDFDFISAYRLPSGYITALGCVHGVGVKK
tara:strand:+ start:1360 stop:1596 length:237 start_codon:yes stop_codon:yes gene_type:complete